MDMSTIGGLVGTLGFPIVCCFLCMWFVKYQTDQTKELNQMHKDEIMEVSEAVKNNTIAIEKLTLYLMEKLGGGEDGRS